MSKSGSRELTYLSLLLSSILSGCSDSVAVEVLNAVASLSKADPTQVNMQ